jgi:CubicO group peptidase (beta-lactamase class C family)
VFPTKDKAQKSQNSNSPRTRRLRQSNLSTFVPFALAIAALTAPKLPTLTAAENDASLVARVKQALPDSPGACVLAIDNGQVIFKQGFGVADVQSNEPCTPATNFRMASVSKQFTATAVLRLIDRHKLSLEDTHDKFFPGFPE